MTKQSIISFVILALTIFTGCNKNTTTEPPIHSPTDSPDIALYTYISTPEGGDPRGYYTPNKPAVDVFTEPVSSASIQYDMKVNTGTGFVRLGGTAATGTYTTTNLNINVYGILTVKQSSVNYSLPISFDNLFTKASGTWSIVSQGLMVLDNTDTVQYAANNRGVFFMKQIREQDVNDQTTTFANIVIGFKK